ncbi:hypothetical protein TrRE_jg6657, partial [Triparma retinervis]
MKELLNNQADTAVADTVYSPSVQESVGRNRADSLFDSVFRSQNFQSSIASSDLDSALSYDGDGSYSDGSYSDLLALTRRLYIGCQFGPRTRSGRTFLDVSRGREIIAWLLADPLSGLPTEAAAVGRMQDAMYFGLLRRVSARDNLLNLGGSKNVFKNDFSIYKVVHSRTGASRLVCTVEGVELTRRKRGDYYVRLSCGGSRVSTKVVMRSSSPVFDEVFDFSPHDVSCSQLVVSLMQYNGYTSDGFIGEGRVALSEVEEGKGGAHQVEVRRESHRREGGVEAKVHVKIQISSPFTPTAQGCCQRGNLKVFVYSTSDVSDGHLAAVDMKIGTMFGIGWWNRVTAGGSFGHSSTSLRKKQKRAVDGDTGEVRHNGTSFNEMVTVKDATFNLWSGAVRVIVRQKAGHADLNERAVAAITIPA